jgi:leucyl-tRNA synthetase
MDTFVDSSWYFLRYTDPKNTEEFAAKEHVEKWCPVNFYVGGAEHAVLHLLYARFFTKVLKDLGYVSFEEPFLKLRNQGLILGPDGEKMSKSRGNVINPDEVVNELGADSLRLYEMFMGPLEDAKPWSTQGIVGVRRFLDRIWNWVNENAKTASEVKDSEAVIVALHKLIKKITADIESLGFNTAISSFMEFHNQVKDKQVSKDVLNTFLVLFYPFAPHLCEELNEILGGADTLQHASWPKHDESKTVDSKAQIVVQINGKVKDKIEMPAGSGEEEVKVKVLELGKVKNAIGENEIKRIIFVPNKLINIVI